MAKYCVATTQKPHGQESFQKAVEIFRSAAAEGGDVLQGLVVVPGNGCWNWGVMVEGPNEEKFMNAVGMLLQPGKYSRAPDDDPAVEVGVFRFEEE